MTLCLSKKDIDLSTISKVIIDSKSSTLTITYNDNKSETLTYTNQLDLLDKDYTILTKLLNEGGVKFWKIESQSKD